jgi:hypothetical protein
MVLGLPNSSRSVANNRTTDITGRGVLSLSVSTCSVPKDKAVANQDSFGRIGLEKRRLALRLALKEEACGFARRRTKLVQTLKYETAPKVRKRAFDTLRNVDDRIGTLELWLKHTTRKRARGLVDRIDSGSRLSPQSSDLPKVTWAKPWRG